MKVLLLLLALLLPALLSSGGASAGENVAKVKSLEGGAKVTRAGTEITLSEGSDIQSGDIVSTTGASNLGLIFRDDTRLSLGPDSKLVIDNLVFEPANNDMSMSLLMKAGTFSVHAGQIAKLAPERTLIRTPTLSLGIRGTSFLVKVDGNE